MSILFQNHEETETDLLIFFLICTVIDVCLWFFGFFFFLFFLSLLQGMMVFCLYPQCTQRVFSPQSCFQYKYLCFILYYKYIHYIYQNICIWKRLFLFLFMHIQSNLAVIFESPSDKQLSQITLMLLIPTSRMYSSICLAWCWCRCYVPLTTLELVIFFIYIMICRMKLSAC